MSSAAISARKVKMDMEKDVKRSNLTTALEMDATSWLTLTASMGSAVVAARTKARANMEVLVSKLRSLLLKLWIHQRSVNAKSATILSTERKSMVSAVVLARTKEKANMVISAKRSNKISLKALSLLSAPVRAAT